MPEGRQAVDQARAAAEPGKDHRPTQHGAQPRAVPVVGTVQPRVSRTLAVRGRRGYGSVGDRVFIVMCERSSAGRNRPIMVLPDPGWRHTPPTWAQEADQRVQKRRRAALEAPRRTDTPSVAAALRTTLGGQTPSWRHVDVEPACTEYYKGRGGWLDHMVATSGMTEIAGGAARVTGYCPVADCHPLPRDRMPRAYRELSDHCPIVATLTNVDRD